MNETQHPTKQQAPHSDEIEIDLLALLRALWKQAWLIFAVTLFFGCAGYIITKAAVTPTYQTYFSIYVNNSTLTNISSITSSDIAASQYLAETAADVIGSNSIKKQVAEQADVTVTELSISTSVNTDSGVVTVYIVTTDPRTAYSCGTALMDIAATEIARIVEGSSVQAIDTPEMPTTYYQPNYLKNVLIAMLLGGALACGLVMLRELMDDKVKGRDDVEAHFDLVNLGSIPDITEAGTGRYGYYAGYGYAARGNRKTR
ncbi:MAG: hypothetical protein LIO70_01020 [Clostridiales bacterium]|nr:hypothetical protein [Clostridiales bacterium]